MNGLSKMPLRPTRLTLRLKTLALTSLMLIAMLVILYILSRTILLDSFIDLERAGVERNVQRATSFLDTQVQALDDLGVSWAHYPGLAAFVRDPAAGTYAAQTLSDATFESQHLNLFLVLDAEGHFVYAKTYNLLSSLAPGVTGGFVVPPGLAETYLTTRGSGLDFSSGARYKSGLLLLEEGTMIVAIQPVPGDDGPAGTLILGRMVDPVILDDLVASLRVGLSLASLNTSPLPDDFAGAYRRLSGERSIYTHALDKKTTAGYTLIPDITGESALILRVDMPRDIYQEGRRTLAYFEMVLVAAGVLFTLMALCLLEGLALRRILRLSAAVGQIERVGDTSIRVPVHGRDELAILAEGINAMLASIQDSQTRLAESRQQLQHVIASISDCLYTAEFTPDRQVVRHLILSPQLADLTGYPLERLQADFGFWQSLIYPDDRPAASAYLDNLPAQAHSEVECRITRADNAVIWVRDSRHIQFDPERGTTTVYGVISDITARKVIEHALRDANDVLERRVQERTRELAAERTLLRTIIDTLPTAVFVKDTQARLVLANERLIKFLGAQSLEEVQGTTDFDFYTPDLAQRYWDDDMQVIQTGEPLINREEPSVLGEHKAWALTTKVPLRDAEGRVTGLVGVGIDITDRKQVEEELRAARDELAAERTLLRTLINSAPDGIYAKDAQGRLIVLNTFMANHLGLEKPEDGLGKTDFDFYPPALAQRYWADDLQVIQTGESVINKEEPTIRGAEERWIMTTKVPLRDAAGRVIGLVGMGRDITERKRMEEQLRAARDELAAERTLLRTVINSAGAGIYAKDTQGRFILLNTYLANFLGLGRLEDALGKTDFDFYAPDLAQRYWDDDRRVIQAGEETISHEEPSVRGTEERWIMTTKVPLRDAEGRVIGLVGVGRDITERKRMEEQLRAARDELEQRVRERTAELSIANARLITEIGERRRAEEALAAERNLLRTLIDTVPDALYAKDTEGRVLICNKGDAKVRGLEDPDDAVGKTDFDCYPRDLAEQYWADDLKVLQTGQPLIDREEYAWPSSGERRWALTTKVPIRDSSGQVVGVAGVGRDITARREIEAERERLLGQMRVRANELATVAQVSRQVTTILDMDRLLQTVVELVKQNFDLYRVQIFLYRGATEDLYMAACDGEFGRRLVAEGIYIALSYTGSLVARAARTREVVVVNDVSQAPDYMAHPLTAHTRSEMAIPMIVGERLIGVLNVEDDEVGRFSSDDLAVQTTLAAQIAIAIENARQFTDSARRLAIIENSDNLIGLSPYREEGIPVGYINPAGRQMLGYESVDEIAGKLFHHFFPPAVADYLRDTAVPAALAHGQWRGECEMLHRSGRRIPVDQTLFVIRDDNGQPRDIATIITDITARQQAQQALEASERRFRSLFETMTEGCALHDLVYDEHGAPIDYIVLDANPAYKIHTGLDPRAITGQRASAIYGVENPPYLDRFSRVALSGEPVQFETYFEPMGRHFQISAFAPGPGQFASIFADITARKQAEAALAESERTARAFQEKLKALHEVNITLSKVTSLDDLYAQAITLGCSELGFERLGLWLLADDGCTMTGTFGIDRYGNLKDERDLHHPVSEDPWSEAALRSKSRLAIWQDKELVDRMEPVGRGTNMIAAMWDGDQTIGWLATDNLLSGQPLPPYAPELLVLYGATIGRLITLRRAQDALHQSQERLELALSASQQGLWDWNIQTGDVLFDERWTAMLGYRPEEVAPHLSTWKNLVHPDDMPGVQAVLNAHLEGHTPLYETEYRMRAKSGEWRWILDCGKVVSRDAEGRPLRGIGTHLDITARKQAEEALRRANRAYRTLSDCNQAMVRATDEDSLLDEICTTLVRQSGYRLAWVGYLVPGQPDRVRVMACAGDESGYLADRAHTARLPSGYMPASRVIRTGAPFQVRDLEHAQPDLAWFETAVKHGFLALTTLPLVSGAETLGTLSVYAGTAGGFDDQEIELLQELASDLAFGITALRTRAERARAEVQLRQLVAAERVQRVLAEALSDTAAAVNSTLNLDNVLELFLENIGRVVPYTAANVMLVEDNQVRVVCQRGYEAFGIAEWIKTVTLSRDAFPAWWQTLAVPARPYAIPDTYTAPEWRRFPENEWIRSSLKVPILLGPELIGVLNLDSDAPGAFTQEHGDRLQAFAHQAANAIHNARLFSAAEQHAAALQTQAQQLALVNRVSTRLAQTLDLQEIYQIALREIQAAMGAQFAGLVLYDEGDEMGRLVLDTHPTYQADTDRVIPVKGNRSLEIIRQTRKPVVSPEVLSDPGFEPVWDVLRKRGTHSLIIAPLIVGDQLIGTLGLDWTERRTFTPGEIEIAETIASQASVAIAKGRLYDAEREQRILAEVLHDTAAALTSTLDFDAVLRQILENVGRVVPHDAANIMFIDRDSGIARVIGSRGYEAVGLAEWIAAVQIPIDNPKYYIYDAIQTGEPCVIEDTHADPRHVNVPETLWIGSFASMPILLSGQVVALLNLDSAARGFFKPEHARRLYVFASQVANAIQNAQLFRAEQKQRALAEALRDTAAAANQTLDLDVVLRAILTNVRCVVPCDAINVMLIEDGVARVVKSYGYAERGLGEWLDTLRCVVAEEPLWQRMIQTRRPLVVPDTSRDADWQKLAAPQDAWIRSSIKAPIYLDDEMVGILHADSATPGAFGPQDAERLKTFADQAAIALRNARLFEAVQQHAASLEQKVQERTLELDRERAQLQAILDSMGEGVLFTSGGKVDYVNPAMIDLLGYSFKEFVSIPLSQAPYIISSADFPLISEEVRRKKIWRGDARLRRKDGTERDMAVIVSQVHGDGDVGPLGAVAILRDISQEKALHELRARFLGRASHELRTPLANIKTRIYLVRKQPERLTQHLDVLEHVTDNMTELVESLLDISRFERGVIELRRQRITLQSLIEDVVTVQRPEAQKKQIDLSAVLPAAPLPAYVDPQRIAQVITNLVTNAVHYTPEGGRITVELDETSDGGARLAVLRVRDTGIGMDPETVEKVFEPFFRAAPTFSPGTGLGLTIAREIIHLHGGEIGVESVLNEGSTFFVKLKLTESE